MARRRDRQNPLELRDLVGFGIAGGAAYVFFSYGKLGQLGPFQPFYDTLFGVLTGRPPQPQPGAQPMPAAVPAGVPATPSGSGRSQAVTAHNPAPGIAAPVPQQHVGVGAGRPTQPAQTVPPSPPVEEWEDLHDLVFGTEPEAAGDWQTWWYLPATGCVYVTGQDEPLICEVPRAAQAAIWVRHYLVYEEWLQEAEWPFGLWWRVWDGCAYREGLDSPIQCGLLSLGAARAWIKQQRPNLEYDDLCRLASDGDQRLVLCNHYWSARDGYLYLRDFFRGWVRRAGIGPFSSAGEAADALLAMM